MKQLLIIAVGICLFLPAHSQETNPYTDKKNVFNLGYFNAFELNKMPEFGFGYKRITKKGALRTSVGLMTEYTENTYYDGGHTISNDGDISFRIGYEHHENFNRLQFYYGGDLVYKYGESINDNWDQDGSRTSLQLTQSHMISLRPSLGLTVFLIPSISISTETYLDLAYGDSKSSDIRYNPDGSSQGGSSSSTARGPSIIIGPLGVFSINFHF